MITAFFALLRAGLWEKNIDFSSSDEVDFDEVIQLAEEQSVVGLFAAGLEHVRDVRAPQDSVLRIAGQALQIEQRNIEMNTFIGAIVEKMRKANIYTLLVKGQGVAQCYERPLWRVSGDVDFFLSDSNYVKAKELLIPLSSFCEVEGVYEKHLEMSINSWIVELHGSLRSGLSLRVDKVLDDIQRDIIFGGSVRSWMNGISQIFLPGINCDVLYVFTHILQHYYKGGIGLRQICDWCRLLWTYRETLNHDLIEARIKQMGLMSEWKAFAAFAVEYLGMPINAMPLYSADATWKRKADKICSFILEVGNFGNKRDMSYFNEKSYFMQKVISLGRRCGDLWRHAMIFPLDSVKFFPWILFNGLRSAVRGE